MMETPVLGVIGGSGLYQMSGLENSETVDIDTPFGKPSAPVVIGEIAGKRVAFMPATAVGLSHPRSITAPTFTLKKLMFAKLSASARADRCVKITSRALLSFQTRLILRAGETAPSLAMDWSFTLGQRPNLQRACQTSAGGSGGLGQQPMRRQPITIEGRANKADQTSSVKNLDYRHDCLSRSLSCPRGEMCYAIIAHVTDYDVWHVKPVSVKW